MVLSDISVPEVYKTSADFRFFLRWFEFCLSRVQYDTENLIDLLDPLRCPSDLLWMLADTCGYKYDERASIAFNRLVILNFARLIHNRGSEIGMIYAAEMNLDQFNLNDYAKENPQLEDRLDDTSIPVNSVSVIKHTDLGFIDIIYLSENIPTDICIEYVRPLGMYCFEHAGVQVNARTKISVDARLTNLNDGRLKPGPTFVGHYRRADYASIQKANMIKYKDAEERARRKQKPSEKRRDVWYRNSKFEGDTNPLIDPGYRTLYSLQLSNNEHIVKALLPSLDEMIPPHQEYDKIFDIGYGPQTVETVYPDDYLKHMDEPMYNLRLNRKLEESLSPQVSTVDSATDIMNPKPAVNPAMACIGDAISLNNTNTKYTKKDPETGEITVVDVDDSNN